MATITYSPVGTASASATAANPINVTCGSHPFSTGDAVLIVGYTQMTFVNGRIFHATSVGASNFTLQTLGQNANNIDGTATPYGTAETSGGTAILGLSAVLDVPTVGEDITVTLAGTWVATILLEREKAPHSGVWIEIDRFTGPGSYPSSFQTIRKNERFRFRMTGWTSDSGDMVLTVADADKQIHEFLDQQGNEVLILTQAGVQIPGTLAVTGAATVTGSLTVTGTQTFTGALTVTGTVTGATGSAFGTLTLADGSITDSSAAISFGDENLSTTGTLSAGVTTVDALVGGDASLGVTGIAGSAGAGGTVVVTGGVGDSGAGGAVTLAGGAGDTTASVGGQVNVTAGAGASTGLGGAVVVTGGAGAANSGATAAAGGADSWTTGAGGAGTGQTGGASGALILGTGAAGTATTGTAGASGAATMVTAAGGAASGAGSTAGAAGTVSITAGDGGANSASDTDTGGAGGSVIIKGGTGGTGTTAGLDGTIFLRPGTAITPTIPVMTQIQAPTAASSTDTLTTAEMLSGIYRNTPGASIAVTTPTGTALTAAIPGVAEGDSFELVVMNLGTTTQVVTLTGGADISLVGFAAIDPGVALEGSGTSTWRFRKENTANVWIGYRVA